MVTDHSRMRLGRRQVRRDPRTLRLAKYFTGRLPAPPASVDWSGAVKSPWGMLLNDSLGDCTIAGILHLLQAQSANAGGSFAPTDAEALTGYEQIDGYNPADPSTDQGGVLLDVLNYVRKNGIAGQKVLGFASVNPQSPYEVRQAIALFGGIYVGAKLPISAQRQQVWYNAGANDGGVWGGHCIPVLDFDQRYLKCVTWGATKTMTTSWFSRYCDEAYAVISADFLNAKGIDPSGFNLAQLTADLSLLN